MAMTISTQITQMEPDFINGIMVLGRVTVVVNFQENDNYFGGQVVLTNEYDDISFTNTNEEIQDKAIKKAKENINNATLMTHDQPK